VAGLPGRSGHHLVNSARVGASVVKEYWANGPSGVRPGPRTTRAILNKVMGKSRSNMGAMDLRTVGPFVFCATLPACGGGTDARKLLEAAMWRWIGVLIC